MVLLVTSKDMQDYESRLAALVTKEITAGKRITFIDCCNRISQYLFRKEHLHVVMANLFIARVERFHDFLDLMQGIQFNYYFRISDILLVSSYNLLLFDIEERDKKFFQAKTSAILNRLEEKHAKDVIVLELDRKWATQSHLRGM